MAAMFDLLFHVSYEFHPWPLNFYVRFLIHWAISTAHSRLFEQSLWTGEDRESRSWTDLLWAAELGQDLTVFSSTGILCSVPHLCLYNVLLWKDLASAEGMSSGSPFYFVASASRALARPLAALMVTEQADNNRQLFSESGELSCMFLGKTWLPVSLLWAGTCLGRQCLCIKET